MCFMRVMFPSGPLYYLRLIAMKFRSYTSMKCHLSQVHLPESAVAHKHRQLKLCRSSRLLESGLPQSAAANQLLCAVHFHININSHLRIMANCGIFNWYKS